MQNDCYCEACEEIGLLDPRSYEPCSIHDPRIPVVREIIARLGIPRVYAGDWPRDMALRILTAIDKVENNDN